MINEENIFQCLDPRGVQSDLSFEAPTERRDLEGKTIYFVDIVKKNSDVLLKKTMKLLSHHFPDTEMVYYPKTTGFTSPEPESWWDQLEKNADAAVVAVGD